MNAPSKTPRPKNRNGAQSETCEKYTYRGGKFKVGIDYEENRNHLREVYRIPDAWRDLGLEGDPRANCKSPWRDEKEPSFSIYDDGRKFKDHGADQQGDVFEFVKLTLDTGFKEAARWVEERNGIMRRERSRMPKEATSKPKLIEWPGDLVEGTAATWEGFAGFRGLSFPAVHAAVHAGILRFVKADGHKCFAITDEARKAGEIRRIDGKDFKKGKVFGLSGVDKSWLVGSSLLPETRKTTPVFISEGATDFLAAWNAYSRYRRAGGERSWLPLALLGASGKRLHPDLHEQIAGRAVRLAPDGDDAGRKMADHWGTMLSAIGCPVEILEMPRGRDLRDMLEAGELKPEEIFS
jgi:hypothetical protein